MCNQLSLYKAIYPSEIVHRAIKDYKSISNIILLKETDTMLIYQIDCDDEEFKLIKNEFCNYLIALRNVMKY